MWTTRFASVIVVAFCASACDSSNSARIEIEDVDSVGSVAGEADAFAHLSDVSFVGEKRLLIADAGGREVWLYDRSSDSRTRVGRRGSGPGEYQAPQKVDAEGGRWVVYDGGASRVVIYSSDGSAADLWLVDAGLVEDMEANADRILFTSGLEGTSKIVMYDWSGRLITDVYIGEPGGTPVRPGHVCVTEDEAWYLERSGSQAFPLSLETLSIDSSRAIRLAQRDPEDEFPMIMGFECNDQFIVAALLNPQLTEMQYVIHRRSEQLTTQHTYPRTSEGVVDGLGFLAGLEEDLILSFRTRPFSKIVLSRLRAKGN